MSFTNILATGMLPETMTQCRRIVADSGVIIDQKYMDRTIRTLKAQGIYSSCKFLGDANFAVKKDGSNAVSTFYDISGNNNDDTQATGSKQPIWSSIGLTFDGTDFLLMLDSADWAFDTGDFTIDSWFKRSAVSGAQENFMGQGNATLTGGYTSFGAITLDNKIIFSINDESKMATSTGTIADTNWHHLAFVRYGNTITIYIDGVADGTVDVTGITAVDTATKFGIGQLGEFAGSCFSGLITGFSIFKGTARWTTNFTPPTRK